MNQPTLSRAGGQRLTGVVDTLSAGYKLVNARPWIVFIPVLLDLFFLFGPRVSVAPLIGQAMARASLERFDPTNAEAIDSARKAILSAADDTNLLSLLAPGWASVPSIMPVIGGGYGSFSFVTVWSDALALGILAIFSGLMLGCVYRAAIGDAVRGEAAHPIGVLSRAARAWLRMIGLGVVLTAVMAVLVFPLALLIGFAAAFARDLGSFGLAFVVTMLLWLQLYLFFAPDAIFVSRVGPIEAMRRSVAIVRVNFWSVVRIVALITIILLGMGQVWVAISSRTPWGPALGIVGNAYIASGLIAASMLFYRERLEALPGRRPSTVVHSA